MRKSKKGGLFSTRESRAGTDARESWSRNCCSTGSVFFQFFSWQTGTQARVLTGMVGYDNSVCEDHI